MPPVKYPSEPPRVELPAGTRVAEGELQLSQLQDLAERVTELKRVTMGSDMKLSVRIEIGGKPISDEVAAKVNGLLAEVSDKLKLQ